jgi:hypothetical protein
MLIREDGEAETINFEVPFVTGGGEIEDNGSIHYPDTLKGIRTYGQLDNSSAGSDEDYFILKVDSNSSGEVSLNVLNDKPLYFSCTYSSKTFKVDRIKSLRVSFTSSGDSTKVIRQCGSDKDTVKTAAANILFRLGNEDAYGTGVRLQPGSMYILDRK